MDISYHKWLELKITNSYFKDGICSVLRLVPFEETAVALRNYDVLLRKTDNIISFYCGTTAENFDVAAELSGLKELYFQLLGDDPLFSNYTEIPSVILPELFVFQNFDGSSQLQIGETVSEDDLMDPTSTDFNTQFQPNCIGALKLDLELSIKTATEAPTLTLDFEARDVFSQYLIITPNTWDKEKTTIEILGARGETYPNPVPKQFKKIGEKTAQVITSDIAIPLAEDLPTNPTLKINYANTFSNMTNQLEIKLPNPGVENLKIITNEQGDSSFCSTTIVYV